MNLDFLNIDGLNPAKEEPSSEPFRWPAEWEPQDTVWFTWPHRNDTWPAAKLAIIQQQFAEFIAQISHSQKVCINAAAPLPASIHSTLGFQNPEFHNIELHDHASNDVWCRDHGATFVIGEQSKALHAIDWQFNAWGGKFPPWELDDKIAAQMATAVGANSTRSSLFLEGGAIEGNGAGVVLTTEAVALNPNRNPSFSKAEVEAELSRCLGAKNVFWLPAGIEGDAGRDRAL